MEQAAKSWITGKQKGSASNVVRKFVSKELIRIITMEDGMIAVRYGITRVESTAQNRIKICHLQ
jgi:hypothetical protein